MEPQRTDTGNPFLGLNAFTEQHRQLFNGREDFIARALERLSRKAQNNQPFLLLLGNQGAGKSSLLHAGVLANLQPCGLFPNIQQFHSVQLHPCDIGVDPISALVIGLQALKNYPLLDDQTVADTVKLCKEQPSLFIEQIKQRKAQLPSDQTAVVTVRQMEQLFINDALGEQEKHTFIDLLVGLSSQCGVFVLATLRSDFYYRLSDYPGLMWLKQRGGQLDVLPPTIEQIRQMIAPIPLKFEPGKEGQPALDEYIAQRTDALPNSLPAMEFILKHLYDNQSQNGLINFSTYRKLGGLERAVAKTTEQVYESLDRASKRYFTRIINRLAIMSKQGHYERVWAKRDDLLKNTRAQQMIETFVEIGVFIKHTDANQQIYIALAHDCLFELWPRLIETLDSYQKVQLLKQMLETQASEWKSATRPSAYLLSPGKALDEGKLILKQGGAMSPQLRALIQASMKRATLQRRIWLTAAVVLVVVFGFTLNNAYNAKVAKKQAEIDLVESHKLIEFLIDDESVKLDEIGRLDIMLAGSERSFDYFKDADDIDDSTSAKQNRSLTFFQIGQVFLENEHFARAIAAFEKNLELNNELVSIHPNGFDYHLDLAHTNYWIGVTYLAEQNISKAEQSFLFYQKNAFDLVELQPDSALAKMELSRAFFNLAKIAAERGQMESATQSHFEAVKFAEKGKSGADQHALENTAYSYHWLAEKYLADLKIAEALEMIKGEERIRALLLKRYGGDVHALRKAETQWGLAQTHLLLGQRKQAQNIFAELAVQSASMVSKEDADSQWRYINAFSLSGLAYAALQSGNLVSANGFFQQSYVALDDMHKIALPKWDDAFYERQYWFARLQQLEQNTSAFAAAMMPLNTAQDAVADKWKKRAASLQQKQIDIAFEQVDLIAHPHTLIADIEYASIHKELERVQSLWQRVPQEMWLNTDLENMRPTLRQQIKELNAE